MPTKLRVLIFFLILSLNITASELNYTVKENDTVISILLKENLRPIYGKNGFFKRVLKLNPFLKKDRGNKIAIGDTLILPKELDNSNSVKLVDEVKPIEIIKKEELPPVLNSVVIEKDNTNTTTRTIASSKIQSRSDFNISLSSRFVRVESTDTRTNSSAILLSDSGLGFLIGWGQSWNQSVRTHIDFESYKVSILDSSTLSKSLVDKNQNVTSYAFGADVKLNSNLILNSTISYSESIVFRANSLSTLTVEKFVSSKIASGINYNLIKLEDLKFNVLADVSIALPSSQTSYNSKLSFGKLIGFGLEDKISNIKVVGKVFYKDLNLKMSDVNYKQTDLGISFGLTKYFGEFD